jgi:hypothetical protein
MLYRPKAPFWSASGRAQRRRRFGQIGSAYSYTSVPLAGNAWVWKIANAAGFAFFIRSVFYFLWYVLKSTSNLDLPKAASCFACRRTPKRSAVRVNALFLAPLLARS